jgi:peptidoglycan/LPS O-acetylase OafA/YrhL
MIRSRQWDKLFDSLFSSVFRRAFRLFVPCLLGVGIMTAMATLEWRTEEEEAKAESKGFLRDYWKETMFLLESFRFESGRGHLHQLWTIPVSSNFLNSVQSLTVVG